MLSLLVYIVGAGGSQAVADDTFSASGQALLEYNGPVSSLTSVKANDYRPVLVPIAAGQTINAEFSSSDLFYGGSYYLDQYQFVIDDETPVAVEVYRPDSGHIWFQVCRYYKNGTTYSYQSVSNPGSYWSGSGIYSIFVRSDQLGSYQLSIRTPLAGAEAGFSVESGSAKAPHGVTTDSSGAWSQTFEAGSTYQVSMNQTGYTFSPDTREFDGAASDLDFTGTPSADVPEITGLTLDSSAGTAGQEQTINAVVYADAPAGTMVSIVLLNLRGAFADTYSSDYTLTREYSYASISNGEASLSLPVRSTLEAGHYTVCAQIAGSAGTVSQAYTLTDSAAVVPAITDVNLSSDHQNSGQSQTIDITVQTSNVPDNTAAVAVLTDSSGNPLSPAVTSAIRSVAGNQVDLSLATSALQIAGNYQVKVTINTATPLVEYKSYVINDAGSSKNITGFTVPGQVGTSTISSTNRTVVFHMPNGTDVSALEPAITIDGADISPASGAPWNFGSSVTYRVTAADGTEALWKATCIVNPLFSSEKAITAFSLTGQIGEAVIDPANCTVTLQVNAATSLTAVIPSFTLSTGATASVNGVGQTSGTTSVNFRSPVVYTVTAEDGSTADWTVYINSATRNFVISGGTLDRSSGITGTVTVSPSEGPDHSGTEVVVFQLLKDGKEPVSVIFTERDITAAEKIDANFTESGSEYSVRVFVFDQVTWDAGNAPTGLADPLNLQ